MSYAKEVTIGGGGIPGWPDGVMRYFPYADTDCDGGDAAFDAIPNWALRLAATKATLAEIGTVIGERNCATTPWVVDTDNGPDLIDETTTTPGGGTLTQTSYFSYGFGEGSYDQLVQSAPFVPTTNQFGSLVPLVGNQLIYLDNGTVKAGFDPVMGGVTRWFGLSGGPNLVNSWRDGSTGTFTFVWEGVTYTVTGLPDPGRQTGSCMYATPYHDFVGSTGMHTSEAFDTGWNPVSGGSFYKDYSGIQFYEKRNVSGFGDVVFIRHRPKQWALRNVDGEIEINEWRWLEGARVKNFVIILNQRTDTQMLFQRREQQLFGAFIAPLWHHSAYTGNNPGNSLTESPFDFSSPNDSFSPYYNASEYWVAAMGDNGTGVVIESDFSPRVNGGQNLGLVGNEDDNACSSVQLAPFLNMDIAGVGYAFSGAMFAGTLPDFRTQYQARNTPRMPFSWSFGTGQTRGWASENAPAKFNSDNRYAMYFGYRSTISGQAEGRFTSPTGAWRASTIPTIYIKGKFSTGLNNFYLVWYRPGRDNGQEYYKPFTVPNNAGEQTIAIPMSGETEWRDIIAGFRLQLVTQTQSTSGTETFVPTYIGNVNPG